MVKTGPAFFDYIKQEKPYRRRNFGDFIPQDFLSQAPLFLLILLFAVIVIRIFYIQVLRADYYKTLSNTNRTRTEVVAAPRGIIYDRRGKELVSNSAFFKVGESDKSQIIGQEEALRLISQGKKVENVVAREYLYKDAFAHVLGYLGKMSSSEIVLPEYSSYDSQDFIGKMGLERQYEKTLHGTNGKRIFEVDAAGAYVRELGRRDSTPGKNLKTTLDLALQLSVASSMKDVVRGTVVVSDPATGGILALYSSPSFDPNLFTQPENSDESLENILSDTENQPLLNRAISGSYPPGSTFKLITATAALEKGNIKPDTQIPDTGILRIGDFSFGNWYFLQYGKTDGPLDVIGAIKRSNDIFFYKAAEGAGVDYISSWAERFGLGKKLGIDLPAEEKGAVPTVSWKEKEIGEQWYLGDTYNYGIGQGYLLTTPLQVNMFTSVFANGGTLYRPHLVSENKNNVITKNFLKHEYIDLVREGMKQSCDTGGVAWPLFQFKVPAKGWSASSGKSGGRIIDGQDFIEDSSGSAKMVRIALACKTGTAETGGKDAKPHAWISVFAPYHKPEIVVTVLVENGGEGSSVAGPIAKKILQEYFERK